MTPSTIQLTWQAPGDNNSNGTAAQYDIRYSTSQITAANFASAWAVPGVPSPATSGTNQSVTVNGLTDNTACYFAIKTADEVPNWSSLSNVLTVATPPIVDLVAPAPVGNLSIGTVLTNSIQLNWVAQGDDGSTGTAAEYDLRYSLSAITAASFASATMATGMPLPTAYGTDQSVTVSALAPNTTYYFAMKVADEVPNYSTISNAVSAQTP